jgi:hypothetical protein
MSEQLDPLVECELEKWRVTGEEHEWADVLARAGVRRKRLRSRSWRRVHVAIAVTALVGAAAPALALVADRVFNTRGVPGTIGTTRVELGRGRTAILRVRSHGSPLSRDSHGFYYLRPEEDDSRTFDWALDLDGLDRVVRASIGFDGRAIELCHKCADGSDGRFVLHGGDALTLLNGQAIVKVGSVEQQLAPAAGGRLLRRLRSRQ